MNRLIILILSLLLLNHCSSNEKLRIWKSKEKNLDNNKNIKKLFSDKKKIITEFNQELKLDLSKIRINEIIVDNQNNFGALNYDGLNKKVGSYKFSKMEGSSQINYKPIFLDDGLIFFDKKGNIIRYDSNNKIIWQVNYYSKSEKKNES